MKTAHRNAARAKRQVYPLIPKFWQPKVDAEKQLTAQVIHWDMIARFTAGTADHEILWNWIEAGLTYSEMARLLIADGVAITDEAVAAIRDQLEAFPVVAKRFQDTGRAVFTGPELCIARAAAHVMDQLIQHDRHGIAWAARQWSNSEMAKLKNSFTRRSNDA